jgi:hypothetical protein
MAITWGSCCTLFCCATTMPKAAPTRARPTMTRTTAGQPPLATKGANQTRPPASARHCFCRAVSAWRQTSAAPAQAKATGQKICWESPKPVTWAIHSRPLPRATRATSMPQSIRRLGLVVARMFARLAAASPGALVAGSGGINSHSAPYASTPMNWVTTSATKPTRMTITGQPRCRANPVQTPPSMAPSGTRVARRRPLPDSALGCSVPTGGVRVVSPRAAPGVAAGAAWTRLESVLDMMLLGSHVNRRITSGFSP